MTDVAMSAPGRAQNRRCLLKATAALGAAYTVAAAYPFLASMTPSARVLASAAPVEADISRLLDGEIRTVVWCGRPIWILKRSPEMLSTLGKDDYLLADPASRQSVQPIDCVNATRSIRPSIFVAIGICTHLGCSLILHLPDPAAELAADWHGGFLCPCHGSKFDLAGRVFKHVSAPTNLEIPPYPYLNETRLLIDGDKLA